MLLDPLLVLKVFVAIFLPTQWVPEQTTGAAD